jgi:hypothetical protein
MDANRFGDIEFISGKLHRVVITLPAHAEVTIKKGFFPFTREITYTTNDLTTVALLLPFQGQIGSTVEIGGNDGEIFVISLLTGRN